MTDTRVDTATAAGAITEETIELNRAAAAFSQYLFSASRTVLLHTLDNRASLAAIARVREALNRIAEFDGRASLRVSMDLLMVNDLRIVVDSQFMGPVVYLVDEMKKRRVEEIDFDPDASDREIGRFLQIFFGDYDEDDVFGTIQSRLADEGIRAVRIVEWIERRTRLRDSAKGTKEIREESNVAYGRAVLFANEVLRNVEQQRAVPVPKALRLTQQIVDIIRVDESVLLGLASIKSYDEYTFEHSANVAVLSMLIADRIGMARADVAGLGVAAFLHDIGKTHVPRAILNKNGPLDPQEWRIMQSHALFGALELSRSKALRSISEAIFVALQHHVRYDGQGYPHKPGGWKLLPWSRIVTVADYFDAMTTPRVYKREPMTPDRALRFVLDHSGVIFDPFIAKAFIQVMGLYPVGTVVVLDTGQLAVVIKQNARSALMHRPLVAPIPEDEIIDTAEEDGAGGYKRTILRAVYDPNAEVQKMTRFLAN